MAEYNTTGLILGILIITVLGSTLYASDYRAILEDNPQQDFFLLDFMESSRPHLETLMRSTDENIDYYRWRYEDDYSKFYMQSNLVAETSWQLRCYYESNGKKGYRNVVYNNKEPLIYGFDMKTGRGAITMNIDYYKDSRKSPDNHIGWLSREIEITPRLNKETITFIPADDDMPCQLIMEVINLDEVDTARNFKSENVYKYNGSNGLVVDWSDAESQVSWSRQYKNGKIKVGFKSTRGTQVIDPTVGLTPYSVFENQGVTDVFSYNITNDELSYTSWYNNSNLSWYDESPLSATPSNIPTPEYETKTHNYFQQFPFEEDFEYPTDGEKTVLIPSCYYNYQVTTNPITGNIMAACWDDGSAPHKMIIYAFNPDTFEQVWNKTDIFIENSGGLYGYISSLCLANGNCLFVNRFSTLNQHKGVIIDKDGNVFANFNDTVRIASYSGYNWCTVDEYYVVFFSDSSNYNSFIAYDKYGNNVTGQVQVDGGDTDLRMGRCGGFKDDSGNIGFIWQRTIAGYPDYYAVYNVNGTQIKAPTLISIVANYQRPQFVMPIAGTDTAIFHWSYENNDGYYRVIQSDGTDLTGIQTMFTTNNVTAGGAAKNRINQLYFPGWHASTDYYTLLNDSGSVIGSTDQDGPSTGGYVLGFTTMERVTDNGANNHGYHHLGGSYFNVTATTFDAGHIDFFGNATRSTTQAQGTYSGQIQSAASTGGNFTIKNPINLPTNSTGGYLDLNVAFNLRHQAASNECTELLSSDDFGATWDLHQEWCGNQVWSTNTYTIDGSYLSNMSILMWRAKPGFEADWSYVDNIVIGAGVPTMTLYENNFDISAGGLTTINLSEYTTDSDNATSELTWAVQEENTSIYGCSISGEILTVEEKIGIDSNMGYCVINVTDGKYWNDNTVTFLSEGGGKPAPLKINIVISNSLLALYNGITNTVWKLFEEGVSNVIETGDWSSVSAKEGKIVVGGSNGVLIIDLPNDEIKKINSSGTFNYGGNISDRNDAKGYI